MISCIWHPDFDRAIELISAAAAGEPLLWSEPRVEYRYETVQRGGQTLNVRLEPVLCVQVATPAAFIGNVIGDLMSRRGLMHGQCSDDDEQTFTLRAEVPLAEMSGYLESLSRMSNDRAHASAEFGSYALAPRSTDPPDEPMSAALRA